MDAMFPLNVGAFEGSAAAIGCSKETTPTKNTPPSAALHVLSNGEAFDSSRVKLGTCMFRSFLVDTHHTLRRSTTPLSETDHRGQVYPLIFNEEPLYQYSMPVNQ